MLKNPREIVVVAGIVLAILALAGSAGAAETRPVSGAPAAAHPASSVAPATTTAAADPTTSAAAPATQPTAGEHAARIASNFLTLMGNNWADIAWFAGKLILSAILWGVVMLSRQLSTVRQKACIMVDKAVHPSVLTGILLGLLGPAGLSGIFQIIVRQIARRKPPAGPPAAGSSQGQSQAKAY